MFIDKSGFLFNLKRKNSSSPPSVIQHSHLPSLDGFRGISILIVVLGHAFNNPIRLFPGSFGVSIFFVISGFLITTLLLKEQTVSGTIHLKQFYIRRVLRIFPVAYLYLFVLVLLKFIFDLKIPATSFLSAALYMRNTSILYAPVWEWPTGHYWSLSVEEQFYLLFPFILKRNLKLYIVIIISLLIIIPLANIPYDNHSIQSHFLLVFVEILRGLSGILIGSLFSILLYFGFIPPHPIKKGKGIISLFLLLIAALIHSRLLLSIPAAAAQPIIALLIIINLAESKNFFFRFLNNRVLVYIGKLSYSLYIWQQLFTLNQPWANSFKGGNSIVLNLAALALVSFISYNFYEKYFLNLKNRLRAKSRVEVLKSRSISSKKKRRST